MWGLVAGAVEGGAQHGRDGNPSNRLDLLVAQLKPATVHSDRGGLGVRGIDGVGTPDDGYRNAGIVVVVRRGLPETAR